MPCRCPKEEARKNEPHWREKEEKGGEGEEEGGSKGERLREERVGAGRE